MAAQRRQTHHHRSRRFRPSRFCDHHGPLNCCRSTDDGASGATASQAVGGGRAESPVPPRRTAVDDGPANCAILAIMIKPLIGIGSDVAQKKGERESAFAYSTYIESLRRAGAVP